MSFYFVLNIKPRFLQNKLNKLMFTRKKQKQKQKQKQTQKQMQKKEQKTEKKNKLKTKRKKPNKEYNDTIVYIQGIQ